MQEVNTVIVPSGNGAAYAQPGAVPLLSDADLERFLKTKKTTTATSYRCNFNKFLIPFLSDAEFFGQKYPSFRKMVDAIKFDNNLPSDQSNLLENEFKDQFAAYLLSQKNNGKPLSPKSLHRILGAVQSAMKYWKLPITFKDLNIPQANSETESYPWKPDTIAIFNGLLKHSDYRALDAYQYQSGLGLGDIIVRLYEDIKAEYEAFVFRNENTVPCYKMFRGKTNVHHYNCIGFEAMMLIKVMFDERYGENGVPEPKDKIFEFKRERPIHDVYAARARQFIGDWPYSNPCGPHSKRKAFKSALTKAWVPAGGQIQTETPELIEHLMGHDLGSIGQTYIAMSKEDWQKIYMESCLPHLHFDIITTEEAIRLLKKRKVAA